jgi:hypothetical protein
MHVGLMRFDTNSHGFRPCLIDAPDAITDVGAIARYGENLWLAGQPDDPHRYDPERDILKRHRFNQAVEHIRNVICITVLPRKFNGIWWGMHDGLVRQWNHHGTWKWDFIRKHPQPPGAHGLTVLLEDTLYIWPAGRAAKPRLIAYDLETERTLGYPSDQAFAMWADGPVLRLIGPNGATTFLPDKGRFTEARPVQLSGRRLSGCRLIATRGQTSWLLARSSSLSGQPPLYLHHLLTLDRPTGELTEVAAIPMEDQRQPPRPLAVSDAAVYVATDRVHRFDLEQKTWAVVPVEMEAVHGAFASGDVWLAGAHRLVRLQEGKPTPVADVELPATIAILDVESVHGALQLTLETQGQAARDVLRYGAETWRSASRPPRPRGLVMAVDKAGQTMDSFITSEDGFTWWRGRPGWRLASEDFCPANTTVHPWLAKLTATASR